MTINERIALLAPEEQKAINHARSMYKKGWRKRYLESREEADLRRPPGISPLIWAHWYDYPFGDPVLNERHQLARKLIQEGRI